MSHKSREEYLESCRERYPSRRGPKHLHMARRSSQSLWSSGSTASSHAAGVSCKTLPLWMDSYQARHGTLDDVTREKILSYSARTLDRITAPHRSAGGGRVGRKTGRASNRIKKFVPIRCGPQAFDEPGWLEVDAVSHGGGSSSGAFLRSLTLTDFHSGWTELAAHNWCASFWCILLCCFHSCPWLAPWCHHL